MPRPLAILFLGLLALYVIRKLWSKFLWWMIESHPDALIVVLGSLVWLAIITVFSGLVGLTVLALTSL